MLGLLLVGVGRGPFLDGLCLGDRKIYIEREGEREREAGRERPCMQTEGGQLHMDIHIIYTAATHKV